MTMTLHEARDRIAPTGTLRVAINTGNRALVQQDGDRLAGVSPALAHRLAQEMGLPCDFRIFSGAGAVVDAVADWDIAFLAVEPARLGVVAFTDPYVLIEATYALRDGGPVRGLADVDQPGRVVLVAKGAAYDHALTRSLRHATVVRADDPGQSIDRFLAGEGDVVAAVRQTLDRRLGSVPGITVLAEPCLGIGQAMALPRARAEVLPALADFVARAKASGFARAALDASGQGGLIVAP
ncbi:MAG TPA: transporter substrate-binding domain-containing protein [Paracoccaceae bacterium]|nr:transporter substrate-binding domain-containing protein [Paracoccaceae bacterium]